MQNEFGIFKCDPIGFKVINDGFNYEVLWKDISQISVFKRDLITIDRIEMRITYGSKVLSINEELPGWHQFITKVKEIFPSIPKDWDIEIVLPPFSPNHAVIYNRE